MSLKSMPQYRLPGPHHSAPLPAGLSVSPLALLVPSATGQLKGAVIS